MAVKLERVDIIEDMGGFGKSFSDFPINEIVRKLQLIKMQAGDGSFIKAEGPHIPIEFSHLISGQPASTPSAFNRALAAGAQTKLSLLRVSSDGPQVFFWGGILDIESGYYLIGRAKRNPFYALFDLYGFLNANHMKGDPMLMAYVVENYKMGNMSAKQVIQTLKDEYEADRKGNANVIALEGSVVRAYLKGVQAAVAATPVRVTEEIDVLIAWVSGFFLWQGMGGMSAHDSSSGYGPDLARALPQMANPDLKDLIIQFSETNSLNNRIYEENFKWIGRSKDNIVPTIEKELYEVSSGSYHRSNASTASKTKPYTSVVLNYYDLLATVDLEGLLYLSILNTDRIEPVLKKLNAASLFSKKAFEKLKAGLTDSSIGVAVQNMFSLASPKVAQVANPGLMSSGPSELSALMLKALVRLQKVP